MSLTKQELDFNTLFGTLFSLDATIEYTQVSQGLFAEKGANYARNKAKDAEVACSVLYNSLIREVTKNMTPIEKQTTLEHIENHKNLVYDFFLLDGQEQVRIRKLIDKIKKERP